MKKFGLSQNQLARAKVLRQMGVTEDDLQIAGQILSLMPPEPEKGANAKAEVLMGYDSTRLNREKVSSGTVCCRNPDPKQHTHAHTSYCFAPLPLGAAHAGRQRRGIRRRE